MPMVVPFAEGLCIFTSFACFSLAFTVQSSEGQHAFHHTPQRTGPLSRLYLRALTLSVRSVERPERRTGIEDTCVYARSVEYLPV